MAEALEIAGWRVRQLHASRLGRVLAIGLAGESPATGSCQLIVLPSGTARLVGELTRSADALPVVDHLVHNAPWLGIRRVELDVAEECDLAAFQREGFAPVESWVEWCSRPDMSRWKHSPSITFRTLNPGDDRQFDRLFLDAYATTPRDAADLRDDLAMIHLFTAVVPDHHWAGIVIAADAPIGILALSFYDNGFGELNHIALLPGRRIWVRAATVAVGATLTGRGCGHIQTLTARANRQSARLNRFFGLAPSGSRMTLRRTLAPRSELGSRK